MNRIMQHLARLWRARGGIAAVEFVLILPLLVLLMFGTIEIGRILFDYQAVSKSVRGATRYLTRIDAGLLATPPPRWASPAASWSRGPSRPPASGPGARTDADAPLHRDLWRAN